MDRKVFEVLNKMADSYQYKYDILIEKLSNRELKEKQFVKEIVNLSYFIALGSWSLENKEEKVYEIVPHLPVLKPKIFIEQLNETPSLSTKSLLKVVEWFYENFFQFYHDKENQDIFIKEILAFNKETSLVLNQKNNNMLFSVCLDETSLLEKQFELYYKLLKTLNDEKYAISQVRVLYHFLRTLGLKESLLQNLEKAYMEKLVETKSNQNRTVKCSVTTLKEEDSKNVKGDFSKTVQEKEYNKRKKQLQSELSAYFNLVTLTNTKVLDEEELKVVFAIVDEMYLMEAEEASKIKKVILANNKIMTQTILNQIRDELLGENKDFYTFVLSVMDSQNPLQNVYLPMIQASISQIDGLLKEYIELNKEDQMNLKTDYQEQICLVFLTLKEYGLKFPENFYARNN